jgi:UDP-N-acetylmuramate--alanine ligase
VCLAKIFGFWIPPPFGYTEEEMHYHIVGIGGIGVSALAQLLVHQGHSVSGSDQKETKIFEALHTAGIKTMVPQCAANVPNNTDVLIFSAAVPQTNPEREEATRRDIAQVSYFEYLGKITHTKKTIAVTGTHGKTSTVALLSAGMIGANEQPTVVVGTRMKAFGNSNFLAGKNDWLVVEACEYKNNFGPLEPDIVVLTNAELDHPDYYKSLDQYLEHFAHFVRKAKTVICHADDENTEKILSNFEGEIIRVAAKAADGIKLALPGKHNRSNAALCLAVAQKLNFDENKFRKGMADFEGAARRLEYLGLKHGVHVYDDYGHHPTEIEATVQSLREKYPNSTIGLVFEPHQFARTKAFFNEFLECFKHADVVGMHPIFAARDTEVDKKAVSIDDFIEKKPSIAAVRTQADARQFSKQLKENDVLIFMGAGNIDAFAHEFMQAEE